ncbi:hypothetical protein C3F09_08940 [candidate division GN15 bacterium]|uniref:Long-chain fatty acid transporter n=1 Tax=candidate division GN15 bacterium TaxID=2072418 RepID=A0A855X2D2_9BACT|nr:MAG: hypothetical protein C3F09_08940 [candidate division GN15 bacterium]
MMCVFDKGDTRMGIIRISARALLAITVISASVLAAGFENTGVGIQAQAMGGAFRGVANDWTATYYNPAGLAYMTDNQWGVESAFLHFRDELTPDYRYGGLDTVTGFYNGLAIYNQHAVLTNPTGGIVGKLPILGETVWGLSIYQPFDQNINWNLYQPPRAYNDSLSAPGQQYGVNLDVVAFQFTAAREIKPGKMSLGLGIQLLRADLVYRDLKFRSTPMTTSPYTDVPYSHIPEFLYSDGNGWGLGLRAGMMYKLNEKANLGVTAALPFNITVKGDARLDFLMPMIKSTRNKQTDPNSVEYLFASGRNVSLSRAFETKLKLPASFGVGLSYKVTEKFLVALDGEYTLWSTFDGFDFALASGDGLSGAAADPSVSSFFTSDVSTVVDWRNTIKAALGGRYNVSPALTVLAGLSVDQGVDPNKVGFTPQFVDTGTKLGFNGGLQLHLQTWDLGLGGTIISNPDLTVDRTYESDGSLLGFPGLYKATTFETILSIARRF